VSARPDWRTSFALYRRLLVYAWPYRVVFLAAIIGMAVTSATEAGFAALMKPLVDGGFVKSDPQTIRWLPLLVVVLFVARGLFGFLANFGMSWIGRNVIFALRNDMFGRLVRLPSRFYDRHSSGLLIAKVIYDVEQVMAATTKAFSSLIKDSLSLMALLGWMVYLNWQLTALFAVFAPVIALAVRAISGRFRKTSRAIQQSMGEITHVVQEAIEGQRVVKIFCAQKAEAEAFAEVNRRNLRQAMKKAAAAAFNVPVVELLAALGVAAVMYFALQQSSGGLLSAGDFMSYLTALLLLLPAIRRLTQVNEVIQTGLAAATSVFALMDEEPERDTGTIELDRVRGHVVYRDVGFRYPGATSDALESLAFEIPPGQTLALVGASGSGKTTAAGLLARFYETDRGEVLLDGVNINTLRLDNLRSHIALVSQETVLFDDSVRNNIAYGSHGPIDEGRLREAARVAHVLEFIERLPEGLDTLVGERGLRLSGGQRQRIAIARALYKNAPILILDEATSSLDAESERYVQEAIPSLLRDRTTLVIAHRLSTIERADRIVVLDRGRVTEQGRHAELLAANGVYARLYRIQYGGGA